MTQSGISIIVCCYNSALRLPDTLAHLIRQKFDETILWEILVINNNSTDNTEKVAFDILSNCPSITFRILAENQPGLSAARNRGIKESSYDIIVFCDDDNWLDPSFVRLSHKIMVEHPAIGVLGGIAHPVYEITPPEWFIQYENRLALNAQSEYSGDITNPKGNVYGAGMVLRKSAITSLFDKGIDFLNTDRKGKSLSSGGDTELCYLLVLQGWKIWYEEQLILKHYIPKERVTWAYLIKLNKGGASSVVLLDIYKTVIEKGFIPPFYLYRKSFATLLAILHPYMVKRYMEQRNIEGNSFKLQYELLGQMTSKIFSLIFNIFERKKIKKHFKRILHERDSKN